MTTPASDALFAGSTPVLYERHLVPLIFEASAEDLAQRIKARRPRRVLEIAAGTGALTRALASALPESTTIVASDLNQPMLDHAASLPIRRPVSWHRADALSLPFADGEFDAVACQFGAMFFPDKPRAFAEARRVLADGGCFFFSVWDDIETNDFACVVTEALAALYPADPPRFLARTPHGYHDRETIESDLRRGGFVQTPQFETVAARSLASSAEVAAIAYCHGTPLAAEILARAPPGIDEATAAATQALEARFGRGPVDGRIQARVVTAPR